MRIELRALSAAVFAGLMAVFGTLSIATLVSGTERQRPALVEASPATSAEVIQGGRYYQKSCARCHAADGFGEGTAPSLHEEDMSDNDIVQEIEYGENKMPAFDKVYNSKQIEDLAKYVRSLN
jgi:mono/diheme cytochrome c family protein